MKDRVASPGLFAGRICHSEPDFDQRLAAMAAASSLFDPVIEERTRAIIEDVAKHRDEALLALTAKFDGAQLTVDQLRVTEAEMRAAVAQAPAELRKTVAFSLKNIEGYSRRSLRKNWSARNSQGAKVGEKFDPFQRVGVYIPGGTAPLVSTALMTVALARVAGCPEIAVCTPCGPDGKVNPALLYALAKAGATEIYRVGGSQAITALALGTPTIRATQKIFGPGNAYVVAAKRLLFGRVSVDLLPGPSEVLVLADDRANPRFVAADLLAQAEHGSGHERVWLVTPSAKLIEKVEAEASTQLSTLARREFIAKALAHSGWLIQVKNLRQAVEVTNRLAPEHCEVMVREPAPLVRGIFSAGAIFVGETSPTVLGDYVAGPSHTLPTGGAGASFAGLTVDQFQRRTSVVEYSATALAKSVDAVKNFAGLEGLDAHARSATIRREPAAKRKG